MVTTVLKAVKAHKTLVEMSGKPMHVKQALALFRLKKELQAACEFAAEEEQKIFDVYKPKFKDGSLEFDSEEDAMGFSTQMKEVHEAEYEPDVAGPVAVDASGLMLTIEEIENLDGFVDFVGGD